MATLNPYINFQGRCIEAMNVYKDLFGGELTIQKAGDSPAKDQLPKEMHDQVLHSHLKSTGIEIMGTDMTMGPLTNGNTVYLALMCANEAELRKFFDTLAQGGKVEQPLQKAFFGWYGALEDKFGKHWMFQCNA